MPSLPHTVTRHKISVADYHQMIRIGILSEADQVELLAGEVICMSPKGSRHASAIKKVLSWLPKQLPSGVQLQIQDPIILQDHSEPEPDLVLLKERSDFYADGHPQPADILLVAEVADSSLELDRSVKAALYAAAGIAEYWIINLPEQQVVMMTQPRDGGYQDQQVVQKGESLPSRPWLPASRASQWLAE